MEIQERLELEMELVSSYNNIGYLHYDMQDYENLIAFLEKALAIYQKLGCQVTVKALSLMTFVALRPELRGSISFQPLA